MNHRKDSKRIVALLQVLEQLAAGEAITLGDAAIRVFGWESDRVFLAIENAVSHGEIASGSTPKAPWLPRSRRGRGKARGPCASCGVPVGGDDLCKNAACPLGALNATRGGS
jgi:hypothetical protein